jgi:UTP-glucose-1-phosphate uridylyltransferase
MDNLMEPNGKRLVGIIPAAGAGSRLFPYNGGKEVLPVGRGRLRIRTK